jgi:hypothetical protein
MAREERSRLVWEELGSSGRGVLKLDWDVFRTRVPGGWLVLVIQNTSGLTFYPDPEHKWDGGSV